MPPSGARDGGLSREKIIAAAVVLADAGGLAGLSMRALARTLTVEAMSLYHHVANKEALIDGMVDQVIGEVALPEPAADWRVPMRRRAAGLYGVFTAHRWASAQVAGRINVGPNMLRLVDATLGCLTAAGFTYPQADRVWNAIDSYVHGFTQLEQNFPLEPQEYAAAARQYLPLLPVAVYPHLNALSVLVADGEHDGRVAFEPGLECLLAGLEGWLSPEAGRCPAPHEGHRPSTGIPQ